jgi:CrcB protein
MMTTLLWIMLGGAVGSGARYLVVSAMQSPEAGAFPYGTLTVNLVGCLIIGVLATLMADATGVRATLKLALITGCLGGFTTFSAFGLETWSLLQHGAVATAASYVLTSTLGGVLLAWGGYRLVAG